MAVSNYFKAAILLLLFLSCSTGITGADNEVKTVRSFFKATKYDHEKIRAFIATDRPWLDDERLAQNLKLINYLNTHFYNAEDRWYIQYDTSNGSVQYKNIVVPYFKSADDTTIMSRIFFSFDNTKRYLPDTIISAFYIETYQEFQDFE